MRATTLTLTLSVCLFGSACASSNETPATSESRVEDALLQRANAISSAFNTAMHQCPDRAWPGIGAAYRSSQVMLTSRSAMRAFLWNDRAAGTAAPPALTPINASTLGAEWFSMYTTTTHAGAPTVGIALDKSPAGPPGSWADPAASLAFHEAFHFLGQPTWPSLPDRAPAVYPEPVEQRVVRGMLRATLLDAVLSGSPAALGNAAYWNARYASDFAADLEAARGTDVREGSAEFVEVMMKAIAERGCTASDEELVSAAIARISTLVFPRHFSATWESYEIGLLAGLLLRRQQTPGWEARVAAGTPPADVLLGGTTAIPEPEIPALREAATAAVAERNAQFGPSIDSALAHLASPSYYRIPLSAAWLAGSFGFEVALKLVGQPGSPTMFIDLEAEFESPAGHTIQVSKQSATQGESPCESGGFLVTVPISEVVADGEGTSTFSSANPVVSFRGLPARVVDADGLPWLCPILDPTPR